MYVYEQLPEYLSPSSLHQLESNPTRFYLQRCAPERFRIPPQTQTFPMAVGSAFDAMVKVQLARELELDCPDLKFLLEKNVTVKERRQEAIELGLKLLNFYINSPAYNCLLNEEVEAVECEKVRGVVGGVPILGIPDARTKRGILDWKTTGASSPHAGYKHCWREHDFYPKVHSKKDLPLEELNNYWADQLAIYHWLTLTDTIDGNNLMPIYASIDQITYGGSKMKVAQFRTVISIKWQKQLIERLRKAWKMVQEKRVVQSSIPMELLNILL